MSYCKRQYIVLMNSLARLGVCDISYVPNEEKINRLQQFGELPIVDNLSFPDFETIMTDNYVVSGMTLGELGFLTGRPYASSIITDSPCKAYFLASAVLNEAMEMDSDPDDG
ncbi:hypothetical protein HHI36_015257 [Cryptolaemus montrouzieri]|uniref:Cyclic nucleotide-binding domain-containing protein n=1 Tax=Cryptolaemus montrouzieri TaxID=559131 RepID=A0ABD2N699_9CUCU